MKIKFSETIFDTYDDIIQYNKFYVSHYDQFERSYTYADGDQFNEQDEI